MVSIFFYFGSFSCSPKLFFSLNKSKKPSSRRRGQKRTRKWKSRKKSNSVLPMSLITNWYLACATFWPHGTIHSYTLQICPEEKLLSEWLEVWKSNQTETSHLPMLVKCTFAHFLHRGKVFGLNKSAIPALFPKPHCRGIKLQLAPVNLALVCPPASRLPFCPSQKLEHSPLSQGKNKQTSG